MMYRDGIPPLPKPARRRGTSAPGPVSGRMNTRTWLMLLPELLNAALPEPLRDFRVRGPRHSLIGFYYGADERIHYEVWIQPRTGMIELGLHCEAEPERNLALLEAMAAEIETIIAALGPQVEGEQWTKRWTRIHETRFAEPLSPAYAAAVAQRLARYITTLEPLLRASIEPGQAPPSIQEAPVTRRVPTP